MTAEKQTTVIDDLKALQTEMGVAAEQADGLKYSLRNMFGRYSNKAAGLRDDIAEIAASIGNIEAGYPQVASISLTSMSGFRHLTANGWEELGKSKWSLITGKQEQEVALNTSIYTQLDKALKKLAPKP